MNVSSGLKPGSKLNIRFGESRSYDTVLQELKDNGIIIAYAPMESVALLLIRPGDTVVITYYKADAQYEFDARVSKRYRKKDANYIEYMQVSEHRRIQRRQYFRLDIALQVFIREIAQDDDSESEWVKLYTSDISGGGMRLKSDIIVPDDSTLECMICLTENDIVKTKASVIEVFETDDKIFPYRIRVCFSDITDSQRDRIVNFLFKEQLRLRRAKLDV